MREAPVTFESFFDAHYEAVRRSLAVALGDVALAEELAQDAIFETPNGPHAITYTIKIVGAKQVWQLGHG